MIIIVILNQLTATRWVNHELLKLFFNSSEKSSLAHKSIQAKSFDSFSGKLVYIISNRYFLNEFIL